MTNLKQSLKDKSIPEVISVAREYMEQVNFSEGIDMIELLGDATLFTYEKELFD